MTDLLKQYYEVVNKLNPILKNLPSKLIAIDGKNGAGKTTLGRFLSWKYNVSLIETDLFRVQSNGSLEYDEKEIKRIIEYRLNKQRPIIIESAIVQKLLKKINLKPDFIIYIVNEAYERDDWLVKIISEYESEFKPKESSNLIIELDVI